MKIVCYCAPTCDGHVLSQDGCTRQTEAARQGMLFVAGQELCGQCVDIVWTVCGHCVDSVWTLCGQCVDIVSLAGQELCGHCVTS